MRPDVTVVVCTYNRADLLLQALRSLAALTVESSISYEIVVVDNASTDETPGVIARAEQSATVPIRGVREAQPGVAHARNRGVAEARGEWLAFFDDDQVADPAWLTELLTLARDKQVLVVGGVIRLLLPPTAPEQLAPECRSLLGESVGMDIAQPYSRRSSPGAGNLMVHRSVFERVGVFDPALREAGEDTDLFRRIHAAGIVAWYSPLAVGYHVIPSYRLSNSYLRWKSLRDGGVLARRNLHDRSGGMFVLIFVARLGQALLWHGPRLLLAQAFGATQRIHGLRCLLWRCQGYVRFALRFLAPRWFAQPGFFAQLEFRSERELFAQEMNTA